MNIDALKALGKEWRTGRHHRIYINDLPSLYGLQVQRYKTGSISSAHLNGERISNRRANQLMTALDGIFGKLWYDVTDRCFRCQGMSEHIYEVLVEAIEAKLSEEQHALHMAASTYACRSCGYEIEGDVDDQGVNHDPVPETDDDDAWAALDAAHAEDCAWIRTRAHRVEP